ncbi:MAG: diguanylate cyclase [Burkholderiales bacterium]
MNPDFRSVLAALRRASPVVVDVPDDVRYQLMRRYVEVSVRNSRLALLSFALILFGVTHEAPLWPRLLVFAVVTAITLVRWQLANDLAQRMDPANPRSDWRHDALVVAATLVWGLLPFGFEGVVSPANLAVVVYGALIALAVLSVSYIAALPACAVALVATVVPLVAFMLLQRTFIDTMMALATVMFGFTMQARLRVSHRTLLDALAAQRENAALVQELEGYRRTLEHENALLGDSLRDAAQAANHDPLTGLFNRRYLTAFAQPLAALVLDEREPVTVLIVDIDHFKRVNDTHGHPVGDEVLRAVAQRLGTLVRDLDCLARYGGEEFVVVLRRCDVHRGRRVAEALRHNIASSEIGADDGTVSITVSIGLAQWGPGEQLDEVIQRADRTLYRAKQAGRDRVEVDVNDALHLLYLTSGDSTLTGHLH